MLQELTIDNLAIIKHLSLEFANQMTVLTGETGAGKLMRLAYWLVAADPRSLSDVGKKNYACRASLR